jgi:hypothetical protein
VTLPRGCLVRYREWYGAKGPNQGLKLHAPDVARGILVREDEGEKITYSVADPSTFKEDGGPSIAEEMAKNGVPSGRRTTRASPAGRRCASASSGDEDGNPMAVCFDTCVDSKRTIPPLMHDEHKPEDLDSDGEDHAADDWRYACMSRPWMKRSRRSPRDQHGAADLGPAHEEARAR